MLSQWAECLLLEFTFRFYLIEVNEFTNMYKCLDTLH